MLQRFVFPEPRVTVGQLRPRQDGAPSTTMPTALPMANTTGTYSILPLAQECASAAGHGLPAFQRVSGNRIQYLIHLVSLVL